MEYKRLRAQFDEAIVHKKSFSSIVMLQEDSPERPLNFFVPFIFPHLRFEVSLGEVVGDDMSMMEKEPCFIVSA